MELSFQTKPLCFLKPILQEVYLHEETIDTIVPDSYPDMTEILDAYAEPVLRGKEARDGSFVLSAGIKGGILYVSEEEAAPRCLDLYIPSSIRVDNPLLTEQTQLQCTLRIRSADARILNSRKASFRVTLICEIRAYGPVTETLYELCQENRELQVKKELYRVCLPLEAAERSFALSEEISWNSRPSISRIYKSVCRLLPGDQKLVGDKVVFKGTLCCKIVYLSDDGSLHSVQEQFPFSHYCEVSRDYDEERADVTMAITGCELELDHQEPMKAIQVQVHGLAQCVVLGEKELEIITDAYATKGYFDPQWITYDIDCCVDRQDVSVPFQARIPWPLKEVVDTEILWDQPVIERDPEQATIKIPALIKALGYNDQGELMVRTGRGEAAERVTLAEQCKLIIEICPPVDCFHSLSSDGIEIRSSIPLNFCCVNPQGLQSLKDGTWTEEEEKTEHPSLIVKMLPKDTVLWEIAKYYQTTEAAIKEANGLDTDYLSEEQLLLIPRC